MGLTIALTVQVLVTTPILDEALSSGAHQDLQWWIYPQLLSAALASFISLWFCVFKATRRLGIGLISGTAIGLMLFGSLLVSSAR
jgi:hypothetical protein